ncbi:hypothetical protein OHA40_32290 [Nocardia sp. NBC_00508]|uniref:hypothetical protein n=1 Tax=Nocardia sp. NBC_00508 TaxID=2975992 RepID=UPI002E7FE583|nr:hypothetical protein [Nocardia sp. NBC_00508]WUD66184.1 hypothetical protein OHA40_32290 [Nocardia sp. NBC_00508]
MGRFDERSHVRSWEGEAKNQEADKCAALQWFPSDELPDRMIGYCREAMQHIAANRPNQFGE